MSAPSSIHKPRSNLPPVMPKLDYPITFSGSVGQFFTIYIAEVCAYLTDEKKMQDSFMKFLWSVSSDFPRSDYRSS